MTEPNPTPVVEPTEPVEPVEGTGGIEEPQEVDEQTEKLKLEIEQLKKQLDDLNTLQETIKEKDNKIQEIELENQEFKKMIEKNLRKDSLRDFIKENNLYSCNEKVLNGIVEKFNDEEAKQYLVEMNRSIKQEILKDRETYLKSQSYPPGAGKGPDVPNNNKSNFRNLFKFDKL